MGEHTIQIGGVTAERLETQFFRSGQDIVASTINPANQTTPFGFVSATADEARAFLQTSGPTDAIRSSLEKALANPFGSGIVNVTGGADLLKDFNFDTGFLQLSAIEEALGGKSLTPAQFASQQSGATGATQSTFEQFVTKRLAEGIDIETIKKEFAQQQLKAPNTTVLGAAAGPSTPSATSAPTTQAKTITVQAGDTLSAIAAKAGVSLQELKDANPQLERGKNFSLIFPGDIVTMPGAEGGGPITTETIEAGIKKANLAAETLQKKIDLFAKAKEAGIDVDSASLLSELQELVGGVGATGEKDPGGFVNLTGMDAVDFFNALDLLVSDGLNLNAERQDVLDARGAISDFFKTRKTAEQILSEEFKRRGIEEQEGLLTDLDKRLREGEDRLRDLPEDVRRSLEDAGVTQAQLNRIVTKESQAPFEVLRDLLTERNALAGEINRAVSFAERFANTRLADQATQLAALEFNLTGEQGELADLEDKQKVIMQLALDERKEILNLAIENPDADIDTLSDSLSDAITKIGALPNEQEKLIARQAAITNLVNQGVTTPGKIFDLLNFDQRGEIVGDIGIKEIADTLKSLGIKPVEGGVAGLSVEQRLAARNLSTQIFGKRAGTKAENVGLIEQLMSEGRTVDQISDTLRFSGQSALFTGTLRDAAESIGFKMAESKREFFFDSIDRSLEGGNEQRVRELLLQGAIDTLPSTEAKKMRGNLLTVEFLNDIELDLLEYEKNGGDTNIFTGGLLSVNRKIGRVNDPALQRIATKIQASIQRYRQDISGAAFTESEAIEYRSMFPSVSSTSELNSAKLDALREVMEISVDFTMSQIIGNQAFEDIYGDTFTQLIVFQDPETGEEFGFTGLSLEDIADAIKQGFIQIQ